MASRALTWLAASLLLAGCAAMPAPLPGPATESLPLPTPALMVETLPPPIETVPAEPLPTNLPFSEAPADLATSLYGERLIEWIEIGAIQVKAPVTPVGWAVEGSPDSPEAVEWDSPGAKVGWVIDSSLPGDESGNIILYGHNNINASVFRRLADLAAGDAIQLTSTSRAWEYEVSAVYILPVSGTRGERADYAQHLLPGLVPRLTLISCWPPDNNTHRVIVVAYPRLLASPSP